MEVSGKSKLQKTFSASRGSAEDFHLYCLPCDREGVRVPAHGYCKDCQEHLCESCYKHHKKPAPLRNHVLLDKDAMPQTISASMSRDDFDICPEHEDALKFYCRDHSAIVCNICITIDHRVCKIDYIPKLSKNILEDGELQGLMTQLNVLKDKCQAKAKLAREDEKNVSKTHAKILKEIQNLRYEINACLDQMERSANEEANSLMNAEQKRLDALSKTCEDIAKEAEEIESSLENLQQGKHFNRLFVEMKKAKPRCSELEAKGSQKYHGTKVLQLKFVRNQAIFEMLQTQAEIGKLVSVDLTTETRTSNISVASEDKNVVLEHIGEIKVRSASDENECDITGIEVIRPGRIVVCDGDNMKVKCFNTLDNKMLSEIVLSSWPFDVAVIPQNKLAVTVPKENNIYILSVTNTSISTDCSLNVKEQCWGVVYCQDKLVVSCNYNPGKVIIVNLMDKTVTRFLENLFTYPQYIAVNAEGTFIYISDCGYDKKIVQKLNWQGKVVNSFKEERHEFQQGIQELDDGTSLVCLQMTGNNIVRMSDSCKSCKVTGYEKFSQMYPRAIKYCKTTRRLYVSYSDIRQFGPSSLIKVFKVDIVENNEISAH